MEELHSPLFNSIEIVQKEWKLNNFHIGYDRVRQLKKLYSENCLREILMSERPT